MSELDFADRRGFLKTAVAAGMTVAASTGIGSRAAAAGAQTKTMKKAVKYGMIQAGNSVQEKFQLLKELGFDGVELDSPSKLDPKEVLAQP